MEFFKFLNNLRKGGSTELISLNSCIRISQFETLCAIWYHLYNLQNVKNTHEGVLLLVKLQTTNGTKSCKASH